MQIKDLPVSHVVNAADVFAKDTNAVTTNKITAEKLAQGLLPLSGGLPASSAAIIIQGNKTTHATGAAIGDYVYVLNSTIANRPDGLYKAAQAIPYNTTIDSSYLTALPNGGYNALNADLAALNSQIGTKASNTNFKADDIDYRSYSTWQEALSANKTSLFSNDSLYVFSCTTSGGSPHIFMLNKQLMFIHGIHQLYTLKPETVYSTDGGANWTVEQ